MIRRTSDILEESRVVSALEDSAIERPDFGVYECVNCHLPIFDSSQKFYFGSKWSSFCQPIHQTCVTLHEEESPAFAGVSVKCARCGAPLGRVFSDGPPPTGLRYRMNADALIFV